MAMTANITSTNVNVEISTDGLRATLSLSTPTRKKGAGGVDEVDVLSTLGNAKIDITDDVKNRVAEFIEQVERGDAVEGFVVAEGTAPFEGKDEAFVWSEQFHSEADSWLDGSPVNYYEDHSIITVEKGEIVGSIAPKEPPRDGVDVTGRVIPAKGEPKTLAVDPKAFEASSEDSKQLIAKQAGFPVCNADTLTIEEVLPISGDVDFETGSIDSTVSVHIKGRVLDRFTVCSKGSITVCSAIEAARVDAEGNVAVKQGILGRNMGLVTAKGDIVAKFCSEAHLAALGNVKIVRQVMASHVCVDGKLLAAMAGVIGGCVYAGGGIEVSSLGSEANVPTRVVIGVAPAKVREIAVLHRSIQVIRELIDRITALLAQLEPVKKSLSAEQATCLRELHAKAKTAEARLKSDRARQDKLLETVYTDGEHAVVVGHTIFAGTVIRIGDRETTFRKDLKGPVSIEKRKLKNVTELVAVSKLTGSVTVLKNERLAVDTLLDGFELEVGTNQPPSR